MPSAVVNTTAGNTGTLVVGSPGVFIRVQGYSISMSAAGTVALNSDQFNMSGNMVTGASALDLESGFYPEGLWDCEIGASLTVTATTANATGHVTYALFGVAPQNPDGSAATLDQGVADFSIGFESMMIPLLLV